MNRFTQREQYCLLAVAAVMAFAPIQLFAGSAKVPVAPKWSRFETSFKSAYSYSNAVQDATLKVAFTGPSGDTTEVYGFWDGGRTWRVRFSPDRPGRWTYKTACSDRANRGLDGVSGQFLCTSPVGQSRFSQHGPVQVARDRRHLEHADGTPFFWLADTTWDGARRSSPREWNFYAAARIAEKFTVVQWSVGPGGDAKNASGWLGNDQKIFIDPGFFQRLDAKVDTLKRAGLLSAIVPLLELDAGVPALPDDQALVLARYVVARYGGDPVVWLLAFDGTVQASEVSRWKQIGQALFSGARHAPVVLYPGESYWLLNEFRDQRWVDAFGWLVLNDVSDDALKWAVAGPFAAEWTREPARPLIPFTPADNSVAAKSQKRFTAEDIRRAMYWGVLLAPPVGVSYAAKGVTGWDTTTEPAADKKKPADLPMWQKSLFLPSAKQVGPLAEVMGSFNFWQLRPQPKLLAAQASGASPRQQVVAAATQAGDAAVVYVPDSRTVDLNVEAMPKSPTVTWVNPRTGEKMPAAAVVSGSTCQFPAPSDGDWLLVLKAGK